MSKAKSLEAYASVLEDVAHGLTSWPHLSWSGLQY